MNRHRRTQFPVAILQMSLLFGVLLSGCGGEEPAGADPDPIDSTSVTVPYLVVSSATPNRAGSLSFDTAVATGPAWVVLHRDNGRGSPLPESRIGILHIDSGRTDAGRVDLDSAVVDGETIWFVIHEDNGVIGLYEYSGTSSPDQPLIVAGSLVARASEIQQNDPSLGVSDQRPINNTLGLQQVISPEPAWVILYRRRNGTTFDEIAGTHVDSGTHPVLFELSDDPSLAVRGGDTLLVRLYYDRGERGRRDDPTVDVQGLHGSSGRVEEQMVILTSDLIFVSMLDQKPVNGWMTIEQVNIDRPAWGVLYEDDGNNGPSMTRVIGTVRLVTGISTSVPIELDNALEAPHDVWLLLHVDEGEPGTFEFPGPDVVMLHEGEPVATSFHVE